MSDGHLAAKTEVFVNIVNTTTRGRKPVRPPVHPSNYPFNLPGASIYPPQLNPNPAPHNPPPPSQPPPHDNTHNTGVTGTHLLPIDPHTYTPLNTNYSNNRTGVDANAGNATKQDADHGVSNKKEGENENDNEILPHDQPVRSGVQELAVTLVPVISVCAIFIAVGVIALLFRKKLCLARSKHCKDKDMVSH